MASSSLTNPTLEKFQASASELDECCFYRAPDKLVLQHVNDLAATRSIHFNFGMDAGSWVDLNWLSELPNCQFLSILNNDYTGPRTSDLSVLSKLERLVMFDASTFDTKKKIDFGPLLASSETLQSLEVDATASKTNFKTVLPELNSLRCLSVKGLDGRWISELADLAFLAVSGKLKNSRMVAPTLRHMMIADGEFPDFESNTWEGIEVLELVGDVKKIPTDWPTCSNVRHLEINSSKVTTLDWLDNLPSLRTLVVHDWRGECSEFSNALSNDSHVKEIWVTFGPLASNASKQSELKTLVQAAKKKVKLLKEHPGNFSYVRWITADMPKSL